MKRTKQDNPSSSFDDHHHDEKKKLKFSRLDLSPHHHEWNNGESVVKIELIDFSHHLHHPQSETYHLLYRKFENQRKGFLKWFHHKLEFMTRVRNRLCDYLPIEFIYDRDVILNTGIYHYSLFYYLLEITDKALMLEMVQKKGTSLVCASSALRNDRDVVLKAVQNDINALRFASEDLQNDHEVVFQAFRMNAEKEFFIGPKWNPYRLIQDKEFILSIVRFSTKILAEPAFDHLVQDFHFMLEALKVNVHSLAYADDFSLRASKEFMREAVKINGDALEFASHDCQKDPEILSIAQNNLTYSLQFATLEQRSDRQYVLRSLRHAFYSTDVQYASDELRSDANIILEAMRIWKSADPYFVASEKLRSDKLLGLTALSYSSEVYHIMSEDLQKDKEIIIAAIKNEEHASYILETKHAIEYRNDPDVMRAVVENMNPKFGHCDLTEYPEMIKIQDANVIVQKVRAACQLFSEPSELLTNVLRFLPDPPPPSCQDETFWLQLISMRSFFILFVPKHLITKEFIVKALKQNGACLSQQPVEKFAECDVSLKDVALRDSGFYEDSISKQESNIFNARIDGFYYGAKVTTNAPLCWRFLSSVENLFAFYDEF
ncbi:hypothetical protein C9374_003911 [Naegleria lovaniensis]|uniref:DUF4116 domain-containing protein n=1 Tax=Naegleria lovaniensis TaxID=51637 RepID=A0AA88KSG3_NAELO|nr:uncharacterized protein C9374_003911 [Naegleria lovaniensis]KAG2394147.1 hypothetical protein C9374_003911 [Naegleria lovaniensis]